MFVLPNVAKSYPRANEFAKDLMAALIGAGILRAAGMKLEVGQLSMKTLAFGSGTVALGSAIGREAILRTLIPGADLKQREHRNQLNGEWKYLAALTAFAAGAFALTQYNRVGTYLPVFSQLNRNQALALGGSTVATLVGLRFFGFANEAESTKGSGSGRPQVPVYSEDTSGLISDKTVEQMLQQIQTDATGGRVTIPESLHAAWNARVDVHTEASEDRAGELRKFDVRV